MPDLEQNKNVSSPAAVKRGPDFTSIQTELDQVQQRIKVLSAVPDEQIGQCLDYLLASRGKMIRPGLVLLSGASLGQINPDHIEVAVMVELTHRASLLHDDIIDAAQTRRTRKTANVLWGNTTAVLLGDFLLSRAFSLDVFTRVEGVQQVLSRTAHDICCGELKQNFRKGRWDISEQEYYQIIESKTAALFQSSCRLGAIVAKASTEQIEALSQFGHYLGIAFQISDDLLDILSTSEAAGKTLGTDLKQGKLTLAVILWLNRDMDQKTMRMARLEQGIDPQTLVREMTASGSLDDAISQMQQQLLQAKACLKILPESSAKKSLDALADYVAGRIRIP